MSSARKIEKGKKVRYAVVGAGWISQDAFMPSVAQTSNSELTALFTSDDEKFKVAENYKIKAYKYEDYAKALEENVFDAVYIATPNWRHKEFAVPALEKGIHVFLEKPMEINEDLCREINDAAKKSGAKLGIAYRLHCEEATVNIIDQIRSGKLGDPRMYVSAFAQKLKKTNHRSSNGFDAGPVPDMGVYQINSCRNLFGMEPIEATAIGFKNPTVDMSFHDTVSVTLRFPGERVAQFTTSYTSASVNEYTIVGTKGELTAKPAFGFGEGVKLAYESTIDDESESKSFDCVDQFSGQTDYFSQCVIDDVEPEFSGEEGLRDVRVVIAIKRSIETGKPVKLEHLEPRTVHPTEKQVRKFPLAKKPFPSVKCEDPAEK